MCGQICAFSKFWNFRIWWKIDVKFHHIHIIWWKNDIHVKKCHKCAKNGKKWPNFKQPNFIIFLARNYPKNGTSRFHTMFGSRDPHFLAKSAIFIEKAVTSFSSPYGALTSYQVSKRSLEHTHMHARMGLILYVPFGFQPGTNTHILLEEY